jgi:hypothetical protein
MKATRLAVLTLATAGLIGTSAIADTTNSKQSNSNSSQSATNNQDKNKATDNTAPDGFVLFQEDVVWMTANEPQNHFLRASALLDENKPKVAAGEIRTAAAYLDMQASRGQDQQDQKLKQEAQDLRQQAKQLSQREANQQASNDQSKSNDKSTSSNHQQLKQAFAQANVALAEHLQSLAKTELQKNKRVLAGHDMVGAADSLSAAYAWARQQPQQQASTAITNAQRAARKLLAGTENGSDSSQSEDRAQTAGAKIDQNNTQNQSGIDPSSALDQLGDAIHSTHLGQSQNNQSGNSQ